MACDGKIIKRIWKYFPESKSNTEAVLKFFEYYYSTCGLSSTEIIRYLLRGTTHSTLSHVAKRFDITLGDKGGNVKKYLHKMECSCGNTKILLLLTRNKDLHGNLKLVCDKCKVGELI